jgi:hypothetical protein
MKKLKENPFGIKKFILDATIIKNILYGVVGNTLTLYKENNGNAEILSKYVSKENIKPEKEITLVLSLLTTLKCDFCFNELPAIYVQDVDDMKICKWCCGLAKPEIKFTLKNDLENYIDKSVL